MKTVTEHLRERLLAQAGLLEPVPPRFTPEQMLSLWDSEWCPEFERLMRNRLVLGALRYGMMAEKKRKAITHKTVPSMIKRLELYEQTGNMEHLVDVANLCMVEFDNPGIPGAHFSPVDEHDYHAELS